MKTWPMVVVVLLTVFSLNAAFAYMAEGTATGKIIVVGEDRVAVQTEEGGQITYEVALVKDGDQMVKNRAQMEQIKTLKPGDTVQVRWGKDHADHYSIIELAKQGQGQGAAPVARTGIIQGKVITTGEGRIVVAGADGAQMPLEPSFVRRNGKWGPDPDQSLFAGQCKPGDEIIAIWNLAEGSHYFIRGVARLDATGQAAAIALTQAQLREAYQQVNQLQDQVAALRGMIDQLLKAMPKAEAAPAAPQ
jgi:hypothetical protein